MKNDYESLSHTKWRCQYHIVLVPKYRRQIIYGKYKAGILKGKSTLMIFDRFANLKYKYGNRHFWCRGYFVDTVGRNKNAIQKYIQNQVTEDQVVEQISMKEYLDPFTGEPVKEGK